MGNASSARKRVKVDDQFTRTQGLYPDRERDVDAKKLRRLILDGKLAPCYPGREDAHMDLEECPICFLHYPSLNRSRCCGKGICTECFLQMKSPIASRPTQCPFCKTPGYAVEHGGPKDAAQKALEKAEEQRVIEAKIRMQREEQAISAERAQKREKDISEGRVPDPPSPTLFPVSPQRFPAFPPPVPTQSPQSVNTPQQNRAQSGHSSAERSGSGGGRRRSSLNRRVSAIEPDNLWFRAGSSQGSASNSRRTSERGAESDPSAATAADFLQQLLESAAEGRANLAATPGDAGAGAEEGGEGPSPVLRALARRGPPDMDMDLDDVMLNEAIWLSLQEEEDRQRQSYQGPSDTAPVPGASPDQAPAAVSRPGAQSPGYQDPDEAAASELAKAIAASLEESAAWEARSGGGDSRLFDGSPVAQVPAPSLGNGSGIVESRLEGSRESSGTQDAAIEGRVPDEVLGGEALRGDVNEGSSPARLDAAVGPPLGLSRNGLGVTSKWDKRWLQSPVTGSSFEHELMLESVSSRGGTGLDHAQGDKEGPVRRRKDGSTSENGAAGPSTGPFDLRWNGAPSSGVTSADVIEEGSVTGDVTPPGPAGQDAESHERLPMLGQLRADSVYRSLGDRESELETRHGGLVSATIGPVEPLSLTELVARKGKAGPVSKEGSPDTAGLGQVGEGSVSPAKTVARKLEPALSVYNPSDAPWEQPWFSPEERTEHRSLDESRPRRVGLKAEKVGFGDGLSQSGYTAGTEDRPQETQGSTSMAAGVKGTGQKWEPFSLHNAPWNRLEAGGGFASTNPFAGTGNDGLGKGLGLSDGPSLDAGLRAEAGSNSLAPDPSISPAFIHASPGGIQAVEKEKGPALGTQSRPSRSLSGAASSAPGEASLSPVFSPVKYPPPRSSTSQPGESEAEGGHRRSVSLKETPAHGDEHSAKTPEAKDTRSVATNSANNHIGSDATFEEQLAAAIALSLAQTDADDERRKQHEAFEREAFAVAVQTGYNRAF